MATLIYGYTSISTVDGDSLKELDGGILNDGDMAIGMDSNYNRFYYLDATSGETESIPDIVAPTNNAGTKRWKLSTVGVTILTAERLKSPATTGLVTITGMSAGETRVKTVRDANDTILELGGSYTPTGTWDFSSITGTWPTFNQNTTGNAAGLTAQYIDWSASSGGNSIKNKPTFGTIADQDDDDVAITGGTITGITDLAVADGGTGLSTVALGSILAANTANVLSAITSTTGTKTLVNTAGVISWESPTFMATDTIWDAAGDLVQGTGSNTAAKLTKGAEGTLLRAGASSLAYTQLTMPSTIAAGSVFAANAINTLSAVNSTTGTKYLKNVEGTISWADATATSSLVINVKDYGAVGDGTTDDTAAIQDAIDAAYTAGGGIVFLPEAIYKVGSESPYSLTLRAHVIIQGSGGGILSAPNSGTLNGTILLPVHGATHYPIFVCDQTTNAHNCKVKDLSIDFSTDTGGTASAESEDCGFKITGAKYAINLRVENVVIKNAYYAYYDDTGTFMSTLTNVWSYKCRRGFYKYAGTTFKMNNCYHSGSSNETYDNYGYYIESVYGVVLDNCACDQVYSSRCSTFKGNVGLVINGFDFESNRATTSTPYYGIVLFFDSNEGLVINGMVSYLNEVYIDNTNSLEGYLVAVRGKTTAEGSFTLNGLYLGFDDTCYGTGDGTSTLAIGNASDTMHGVLTGCKISEMTSGVGFSGTKFSRTNTSKAGSKVIELGCSNVGTTADVNSTMCIDVAGGGTGKVSVTANSYLKGNGTSALVERTYSEVVTDLGLVIGTNVQAHSSKLVDIAALAITDGNIIVGNGTTWVAESGVTARTSLGLAIGTDVQAYNSNLTGINQELATTSSPSHAGMSLTGDLILDNSIAIKIKDSPGGTARAMLTMDSNNYMKLGNGSIVRVMIAGGCSETNPLYIKVGGTADLNVTAGANDSGGTGYRLLRVANS